MKWIYSFFAFVLLMTACNTASTSSSEAAEEYEVFCLLLEEAVNDKNSDFVDTVYDFDHLVEHVTDGIDAPEYYEEGFKEGFRKSYTPGLILLSTMGETGYYKFLRMKSVDPPIGLFRLVSEQGVNYHEIHMNKNEDGEIMIEDFYSYLEAELFSQGIKRLYIINLSQEVEDFSHPIADALPIINDIAMLADGGKPDVAFAKLRKLPKSVLEQKIVMLILLSLGQDLGQDSLAVAEQTFRDIYPNDPLVDLKLMEFGFRNGDTTRILQSISKIQATIGEDHYLQMLKATVFKNMNKLPEAKNLLFAALESEPENDEYYWVLLDLLITNKEYDTAIVWFQKLYDQFEENPADYLIYDGYKDFYDSQPYKDWIAKYPLRANPNLEIDSLLREMEKLQQQQQHHGHDHSGHGHAH